MFPPSTQEGLTVIANINFREGKGTKDFAESVFFKFENPRESLDEGKYVVMLTHPMILDVLKSEVAVYPPYGFNEEGLSMLLRGTVEGMRAFLASMRFSFRPPDSLATMTNGTLDTKKVLTERQLEIALKSLPIYC